MHRCLVSKRTANFVTIGLYHPRVIVSWPISPSRGTREGDSPNLPGWLLKWIKSDCDQGSLNGPIPLWRSYGNGIHSLRDTTLLKAPLWAGPLLLRFFFDKPRKNSLPSLTTELSTLPSVINRHVFRCQRTFQTVWCLGNWTVPNWCQTSLNFEREDLASRPGQCRKSSWTEWNELNWTEALVPGAPNWTERTFQTGA